MNPGAGSRWQHLKHPAGLVSLALAVVTLAVYAPVVRYEFIEFDDDLYVTGNLQVQNGLSFAGALWAFRTFHACNWHPLTWLSHMLDCSVFGLSAGGHHLVNLLFHTANTVLLFLLLRRLTGALWRPALVAALFAWHPLHVESVAWVAERKDVLSTLFLILTIWAYARYTARPNPGRYALVLLAFALGLMAKPMLVTLPGLLLLLDCWPLGRMRLGGLKPEPLAAPDPGHHPLGLPRLLLEKVPLLALSIVSCVVTVWAQREGNAFTSLETAPISARLANAVTAYTGYVVKTLWPANLAVYYPLPQEFSAGITIASGLVLAGISFVVWRQWEQRRYLAVGWLWYLVTLLPVAGLVQVGGQAMADRYTYVPLMGVFIMLVWIAADACQTGWVSQPMKVAVTGAALLVCLVGTAVQLQYWRNGVRLFARSLEVTSSHFLVRHNLGVALSLRGHKTEAIAQFNESLRLNPRYAKAHYNLGMALADTGQVTPAAAHFAEVTRLTPTDAAAHNSLGALLAQQGRYAEATQRFLAALKLQPDNPRSHFNLAKALLQQGQTAAAIAHYRVAVELEPAWPAALNSLAQVLATHPDRRFRDGATAVRLAEKANQLTRDPQPVLLNTLAAAYAEAGQFAAAQRMAEQALRITQDTGQQALAAQIRRGLDCYRAGKTVEQSP